MAFHLCELIAPAGSFSCAYHAFSAGADAVYCGLKEFSARKAAVNFTIDELRRLKQCAADRRKKIYVTINTIIVQDELGRLCDSLADCQAIGVDAVVIQDPAVIELVRSFFPTLTLHASTQMGIGTASAVALCRKMGISRIIAPRELSLEMVASLKKKVPDMAVEVFIHGALCYSFSGCCLASGMLLKRSANRGQCAQLCRNYYLRQHLQHQGAQHEKSRSQGAGYFFSCRDNALLTHVGSLLQAGVDAFKIEGRMKAPEYVFTVTKLYRYIIDFFTDRFRSHPDRSMTSQEIDAAAAACSSSAPFQMLYKNSRLTFSRKETTGYFHSLHALHLIDAQFPGHRGIPAGMVLNRHANVVTVSVREPLSKRDGVLLLPPAGGEVQPAAFSIQSLKVGSSNCPTVAASADKAVTVAMTVRTDSPESQKLLNGVTAGFRVAKLSSRDLDLKECKANRFDLYKTTLAATITITDLKAIRTDVPSGQPHTGQTDDDIESPREATLELNTEIHAEPFHCSLPVQLFRSQKPVDFLELLRSLFHQSGDSFYALEPVALHHNCPIPADRLFIRPAQLKKIKNECYDLLEQHRLMQKQLARSRMSTVAASGSACGIIPDAMPFVKRQNCSPRSYEKNPLPFAGPQDITSIESFALIQGFRVVPLHPLLLHTPQYEDDVCSLVNNNPGQRFLLGINSISHLSIVRRLSGNERVSWFLDFFCFVANAVTLRFYHAQVANLLFVYYWIEGDAKGYEETKKAAEPLGIPIVKIDQSFLPPLFMSYGCFFKNNPLDAARQSDQCAVCSKLPQETLSNGKKSFSVFSHDCITYLFQKNE
ncbi:MAG: U32 family peptidase [Chitinivibrionales bacterium]|nr:U32 family peptidase [Chitinivibrionales bacterium]